MRLLITCLVMMLAPAAAGADTRVKDIISIAGVRPNQLIGYGLVIGLNGTGDSLRNSPFTGQSIQSMLDRMGVNVRSSAARIKNVAAVMVTSELPAFIGKGSRIDVTVSSLGDATSLAGGALIMTPLYGGDNTVYAVAQGQLAVTGFVAAGQAEQVTQGVPTSGRIPNGAIVERAAPGGFGDKRVHRIELRNPDFNTAVRVTDAINRYGREKFGVVVAREENNRTIRLRRPKRLSAARFMAEIGNLLVQPDVSARVVIDERTGTIVMGGDVQISTVAVAHGNLTVRVTEEPVASQPAPFSDGETTVVPSTEITADRGSGNLAILKGARLESLVAGLNRIGLKPKGIIAILQAIKSSGALQADLVVQ